MPLALLVQDVLELLGDLAVGPAQVALSELVLALQPELVQQLPQALDLLAVGGLPAPVEHPLQRLVEVPVGQQVVGQLRQHRVGVVDQATPGCRPSAGSRTARSSPTPIGGPGPAASLFSRLVRCSPSSMNSMALTWSVFAGMRDNTLILVLSDNGASQEGGPLGGVNLTGPRNLRPEPMAEKLARIDEIGGPGTHTNYPLGWAMASNTPLRRYKQNTHGGGIRDPLVISWLNGIRGPRRIASSIRPCLRSDANIARCDRHRAARLDRRHRTNAARRHQFRRQPARSVRAIQSPPAVFRDVRPSRPLARGLEGRRVSSSRHTIRKRQVGTVPPGRGLLRDQRSRRPSTGETRGTRALWWEEAEKHKVLPLDDRFGPRFIDNAKRFHGARTRYVFHAGMGHVPTEVAPDVRSRSYLIEALAEIAPGSEGVLIAHGDATSGYSLYLRTAAWCTT